MNRHTTLLRHYNQTIDQFYDKLEALDCETLSMFLLAVKYVSKGMSNMLHTL